MTREPKSKTPRSGFTRLKASQTARRQGETKAERKARFAPKATPTEAQQVPYHLHGLHAVRAAIANPKRHIRKLLATPNALGRLDVDLDAAFEIETVQPKQLDRLLGDDTVHQGIAALIDPLPDQPLTDPLPRFSLVLDQVTDPHNVGAILRSAAAFEADAIVTTARHAARETATLAKAASGAFELVPILTVGNLAEGLERLKSSGTLVIGLDGEAQEDLPSALAGRLAQPDQPVALVLGSEGKGLRAKTKETCSTLARLPLTGDSLASLNVSNAAVLALYIARQTMKTG